MFSGKARAPQAFKKLELICSELKKLFVRPSVCLYILVAQLLIKG